MKLIVIQSTYFEGTGQDFLVRVSFPKSFVMTLHIIARYIRSA